MPNRRDFLKDVTAATAGVFIGRGQIGAPPGKRRELFIGGRRRTDCGDDEKSKCGYGRFHWTKGRVSGGSDHYDQFSTD